MKKTVSTILFVSIIICLSACAHTSSTAEVWNLKEYKIGNYVLNLPETYISKDLIEVKAESNCIAMLSDSNGILPDLWIYEDKCLNNNIREHIFSIDSKWNFKEIAFYQKDGKSFAKTTYDELWYGQNLINVNYYRIEENGKVLSFDFAFENTADYESMNAYVEAIAESLGF